MIGLCLEVWEHLLHDVVFWSGEKRVCVAVKELRVAVLVSLAARVFGVRLMVLCVLGVYLCFLFVRLDFQLMILQPL